jgi:hypothetical protein
MESDEVVRTTLGRYDESLLRAVAARLFKPRSQWPADELAARAADTLTNAPVIDRRLKELPPACRVLLAATGLARRREWAVGQLIELLAALGHAEGLAPILTLLDSGLLLPVLPESISPLRDWESWLGTTPTAARVIVPNTVSERAVREGTGLPQLPGKRFDPKVMHTADGLEWPLRLAVLWQQLRDAPVRLTLANALFKRDQVRLSGDPLLAAPLADQQIEVPDVGVLVMEMGVASGLYSPTGGELIAGPFPRSWESGLVPTIVDLWASLPGISQWDPVHGYHLSEVGSPFSTVALAAMLYLAGQPDGIWTHPADLAEPLQKSHPSWSAVVGDADSESWMEAMLLGWALPLRLVEAAQDGEGWWVRLSDLGRHLLAGRPAPDVASPLPRCLVVQPNGDVIAYRQGLTPGLIAKLARCADWKAIGPACTLGLTAEGVYRGLESGLTLSDIVSTLQQHSGHPVPANVLDLLRRWAGKRERITVHAAATLLEFNSPGELEAAAARGLVVQKLTDRIGLANGELDYKHFRLVGNRDYEAKPQKCVTFDRDGVTFTVDLAAADLLLEAELPRFAEPLRGDGPERRYRITPMTARLARDQGLLVADLEQWSLNRAGEPLPASARLLLAGSEGITGELRRRFVLSLPSVAVTDGVCQWPQTAELLEERLGPRAVAVETDRLDELLKQLADVGIAVEWDRPT